MDHPKSFRVTRRDAMIGGVATTAAAAIPTDVFAQTPNAPVSAATAPTRAVTTDIGFTVNGTVREIAAADNRMTLLDALRESLQLTGSKKGCDHGQCGACTVMVNGRRINACLTLAVMHEGDEITTIEGLGTPDKMSPMQTAFVEHDGYQCGYCTPGQICSATAVLEEIEAAVPSHVTGDLTGAIRPTAEEIKERMSGNICRCGAYANILAAIQDVSENNA
ncbi:aldehyde dehydrogenase iron-sulfur subunit [Acuticoccus sp. M5D2P5]|uniref:aldehyde dehydrogenase iron-sulfur subunit PaoA n=1 Tax=Acuticoccus kalidii TaxID=2910977 RepID=UPI001F1ECE1B|nr:aldehyde dehydrogenase iron-sulfur subunit PaoA [Acuticoccus kalidii]MCF3934981.1 aldehyde dehydrogenase iron-sulfur subunit [Acuticoccus kalidii]